MKERINIQDTTIIGEWKEVKGLKLSEITRKETDTQTLDGLIVKGYETKFGVTNANGERYAPDCLDESVKSYFIANGLNMVVDLQHGFGIDDQIGRVISLESNETGFYYIAYIPRTVARFEQVRNLLAEGILQGFSKFGWSEDYEIVETKDGKFDYVLINKMKIVSVSLVTTPANPIPFESVGETVRNRLEYRNLNKKKKSLLKSKH